MDTANIMDYFVYFKCLSSFFAQKWKRSNYSGQYNAIIG